MKVRFLQVGRTVGEYLKTGISIYEGRIPHYAPFSVETVPDLRNARSMTVPEIKRAEGRMVLERVQPSEVLVLLDEKGKEYTSVGFADYLQKLDRCAGGRQVTFLIGGPYGFSDEVYARADGMMSLSRMTFSHQMVRLVFLEQLYRAFTIIKGEPYHHQ